MKLLVVRLCSDRSLFRARTLVLGSVEIRGRRSESPREREALLQSLAKCDIQAQVDVCPRLATIVAADTVEDAHALAEVRFEEALDLLDQGGFGMSKFALLEAGYHRDLATAAVVPRSPKPVPGTRPNMVFQLAAEETEPLNFLEHVASRGTSDLRARYLRAAHWSRRSRWEADPQLRVLFRWFAIEAACKVDKQFEVATVIAAALGFPSKSVWNRLGDELRRRLAEHPRYDGWRTQVHKRLRDLERWRNDSVHSGFRPWDVSSADLRVFDLLSTLGCARVQSFAREGLLGSLTTAAELAEMLPMLIELKADAYVNDVHGTVLWLLENRGAPT